MAAGGSLRGLSSVTMTSGMLRRDAAHDRALALVAIAAAADHAVEPARRERLQRLERGQQRVGLVRVVDDDEAAAHLADDLEPAFHALQSLQRRQHALGRFPGRDGKAGGDQRVRGLVVAEQR